MRIEADHLVTVRGFRQHFLVRRAEWDGAIVTCL